MSQVPTHLQKNAATSETQCGACLRVRFICLCCTLMCFGALPRAHTTGKVSVVFFTKTSEERQAGCSPLHWEVEARVPAMTMIEHPPRIGHRRQLVHLAEKLTPCPDP